MRKTVVFTLLLSCIFIPTYMHTAHLESLVEINFRIEDVNFKSQIKNVSFNGEEIELDDSDYFKPRKITNYRLPPGRYMLQWNTEKVGVKLATDPPNKIHERIVAIESGDKEVRILIKGDNIS